MSSRFLVVFPCLALLLVACGDAEPGAAAVTAGAGGHAGAGSGGSCDAAGEACSETGTTRCNGDAAAQTCADVGKCLI